LVRATSCIVFGSVSYDTLSKRLRSGYGDLATLQLREFLVAFVRAADLPMTQ